MLDPAHLDFETRSVTDLRASGVYRYVQDPTTGVWGFTYRFGIGPVRRWMPGMDDPEELLDHVANGGVVIAHNAAFEREVWNEIVCKEHPWWPRLSMNQQDCTMARAAAVSHPQDLDTLCSALETSNRKDKDGHALMLKMSRPRRFNPDGTIVWWDEPENVERLMQYCDQDVRTETDVDVKLPPLSSGERRVWLLDQVINERGIYFDRKAIQKLVVIVELSKKSADSEMRRLTDRAVPKCSSDKQIIDWVQAQGFDCSTVKKDVQDDLIFIAELAGNLKVGEVIRLRGDAKKTSTAKYEAMIECMCADSRIRGLLNYHGAGPGRWAGRLVQPQNFPRVDHDEEGHIFRWMSDMLDSEMTPKDVFDHMIAVHGESGQHAPLRLLSRFLRSVIVAAPGKKLVGGDFSNIEGRINAWFADEKWKLKAFADFDLGIGHDLYLLQAAGILGIRVEEVTKAHRQSLGKTSELACGFQGSVGALITMSANYNISPYEISRVVCETATASTWDATEAQYKDATNKEGLAAKEWTALKIVIDGWRASNPAIVQSWWDLQDAAIEAVSVPGHIVKVLSGRVAYFSDGRCLWCILPSGRMICYAEPLLERTTVTRIGKDGQPYEQIKNSVSYMCYKEGRWRKSYMYGGLQCENVVQGTARCVMVDRMFAAEERGYPLILTVHDELLAEVDASRLDLNENDFKQVMSVVPAFVAGLPLAAKAWEDVRYIK